MLANTNATLTWSRDAAVVLISSPPFRRAHDSADSANTAVSGDTRLDRPDIVKDWSSPHFEEHRAPVGPADLEIVGDNGLAAQGAHDR
jgi:hypothetical protein